MSFAAPRPVSGEKGARAEPPARQHRRRSSRAGGRPNIYILQRQLANALPLGSAPTVQELDECQWPVIESLLYDLFPPESPVRVCRDDRVAVQRKDLVDGTVSPSEQEHRESLYRRVFSRIVSQQLDAMGLSAGTAAAAAAAFKNDVTSHKTTLFVALRFLVRALDDRPVTEPPPPPQQEPQQDEKGQSGDDDDDDDDGAQREKERLPPAPKENNNNNNNNNDGGRRGTKQLLRAERERSAALEAELADTKATLERLLSERKSEEFVDERRVQLLKAQNMQLEKQVSLLNDAQDWRAASLSDVQAGLQQLGVLLESLPPKYTAQRREAFLECVEEMQARLRETTRLSAIAARSEVRLGWEYRRDADERRLNMQQLYDSDGVPLDLHKIHQLEALLVDLRASLELIHDQVVTALPSRDEAVAHVQQQLRTVVFELGTLGMSLPTETGTPLPRGETLEKFERAIQDNRLTKQVALRLLERIRADAAAHEKRLSMATAALDVQQELQKASMRAVDRLIERVDAACRAFDVQRGVVYGDIVDSLAEACETFQLGESVAAAQRLLASVQAIMPKLDTLLKSPDDTSPFLADFVRRTLRADVDRAIEEFNENVV